MVSVATSHTPARRFPLELAFAYGRSWWARRALPPGDLVAIDRLERANRNVLIERATSLGPIFKGVMENRLAICVVGHQLGRRVLKEHAADLRPVSIQVESLVPHGFMRQMDGECHRHYRRALLQGINAIDFPALASGINAIVSSGLAEHATGNPGRSGQTDWSDVLSFISTGMLIHTVFGLPPESEAYQELKAAYSRLGPRGVAWTITQRQVDAFGEIRLQLRDLLSGNGTVHPACVLAGLGNGEDIDDTLLGNLIYMVELGRYDLRGLLRWVSKYAAAHGSWLDRIAGSNTFPDRNSMAVSHAFVLETLRLDQSERLMRNVLQDFVFEGYFIPRGALLRVCMWEAHKDPDVFPHPFEFDPARHLDGHAAGDRFSPFGLDHHLCPFAGLSVQLAAEFLRNLATGYLVAARGGDPAVRGPYHWEPAPGFTVTLAPRGELRR